jgi:hypothetical protein
MNPPQVRLGGIGAEGILGAGSLILRPIAFLFTAFLAFRGGAGMVAALRLLARVFEDPTLGPLDKAPIESVSGVQAETGTAGMGDPPAKLGMCDTKLYRAYRE